ncbi:MAG: hypothetical protein HKL82_07340 [Acidimicrobiaceae bacterium]|nr:hypothetical protein [Acidimicrobiaceae bacterium]
MRLITVLRKAAVAPALDASRSTCLAVTKHTADRVVRAILGRRGWGRLDWLIACLRSEELVCRVADGRLAFVALDRDAMLDTNPVAADLTGGGPTEI